MKRLHVFVNIILIILAFLIQSVLFKTYSSSMIKPNLLLIMTSLSGFMKGKKEGIVVGFFCGLIWDAFYGDLLGFYALIFLLIGYINGRFHRLFFAQDVRLPIIMVAASDFGYGLVICISQFFLRGRFAIWSYLIKVILPEVVFTLIVALILYPLIVRMNSKIEELEQRSSGKFV